MPDLTVTEADRSRHAQLDRHPLARAGRSRLPGNRAVWMRFGLAPVAGLAAAAASAPWEQRWLLPLAVGALVALLHRVRLRQAAGLGFLFGLAYVLLLTGWMRVIGVDAWLLIGVAVAGYYALLGAGIALLTRLRGWPMWTACLWVAIEAAMSAWPLGGFPWTRLAWATADTPFALWLPWIGATGVSFLLALAGSCLARAALAVRTRGPVVIILPVVVAAIGAVPLALPPVSLTPEWEQGRRVAIVAAVQGDVPGAGNDLVAVHREVTQNHVKATVALAQRVKDGEIDRPDFVLWPENSTAVDPFRDSVTRSGIDRAAAALGAPVIVGAIVDGSRPHEVLNQGLVWAPNGTVEERYTKRHPVPFGEYVPFRRQLAGLKIGRLDMVPRDMVPGTRTRPLDVAGTRVADLICFDVAFDDSVTAQVRNGGQPATVETSNASVTGTAQLEHQIAISRLRAMETGRTVVIAYTNGISGVIGPDGHVRTRLEPRTTDVALARVPLIDRQTPAVLSGAWLNRALILTGLVAVLTAAVTARRRPTTARDVP